MKIVITGPESTGKTTTAKYLARRFDTVWLEEFARTYVENLKRSYTYEDVVLIAQRQIEREKILARKYSLFFVDTSLIIIKVWFEKVFGKYPYWLDNQIVKLKADMYLLMYPDIEWIYDPVRENPGKKRFELFYDYKRYLDNINANYAIIKGQAEKRLQNSYFAVEHFLRNYYFSKQK